MDDNPLVTPAAFNPSFHTQNGLSTPWTVGSTCKSFHYLHIIITSIIIN